MSLSIDYVRSIRVLVVVETANGGRYEMDKDVTYLHPHVGDLVDAWLLATAATVEARP